MMCWCTFIGLRVPTLFFCNVDLTLETKVNVYDFTGTKSKKKRKLQILKLKSNIFIEIKDIFTL